jgi:hypothetical protein
VDGGLELAGAVTLEKPVQAGDRDVQRVAARGRARQELGARRFGFA